MKIFKGLMLAAALTVTAGTVGLSPAQASTETWNFLSCASPGCNVGTTEPFASSPGGFILNAAGFATATGNPNGAFGSPTDIFVKNLSGDPSEQGLGLTNDTSGQNEIQTSAGFVWISLPLGSTNIIGQLGSTTNGEFAEIFGSLNGVNFTSLGSTNQNLTDINLSALCAANGISGCTFFAFFGVGAPGDIPSNVLLHSIVAEVSQVPLPGALPLFVTGLGMMGWLHVRRKRKGAASTAAA